MKTHTGSCHCGAVSFTATADIETGIECNCSHCYAKGLLLSFVPGENVTITDGEANLSEYRFNKKHIAHLFCKTCGVQPFGRAQNAEGKTTYAINLRCLHDFDITTITINPYDGKNA